MRQFHFIILFLILLPFAIAKPAHDLTDCLPAPDSSLPQYIAGYGSLIQTASKNQTYPDTGENLPVLLTGFKRGWFAKGSEIGFSTTFLGAVEFNQAKMNAVIFKIPSANAISRYDVREKNYCRVLVEPQQIKMLNQTETPSGQIWIYTVKNEFFAKPTARYPLVQSYVDIFISGCLEIQKKFNLPYFANDCVKTTSDWPYSNWVNDRIYPRRPFIYQPEAQKIDSLLKAELPRHFQAIRIE